MRINLNLFFLASYLIIGFIPNIGAVDRIATHWLYLNVISFLGIIYFLYKKPDINIIKMLWSNKPLLILITFGLWALLSLLYSINLVESLITLGRLFSLILATILICIHLSQINNLKNLFVLILLPIIIFEIVIPLFKFFEIISVLEYSFMYANDLKTFTPNKNITAAIIAGHIGFFFIFKYFLKKLEWVFLLLIFGSTIVIFFLSARASIIGLILSLILVYIITLIKKKENINYANKVFLSVIFGFFVSNLYLGNNNTASLKNRLTSLNTEDESTNTRIRFYKHGLQHLLKNPIIGIGIGNWKQKSIEYDSQDIQNYIVPYHLHNDFLQYGTETGVIGMLIYMSIFLVILLINIKRVSINYYLSISLIISISVLFIDSNLNFPHHRPIMMILLAFIISLTELNRTNKIEK